MAGRPVPPRRSGVVAVAGVAHLDLTGAVPTVVVDDSGWLDIAISPGVRAVLDAALGRGPRVLAVDLSRCELADVYGLGMLERAHRRAALQGTELVLVGVNGRIARVLRLTGLDAVLPALAEARISA